MQKMQLVMIGFFTVLFTGCNGQLNKNNLLAHEEKGVTINGDSLNKPKVDVRVNRKYDDKGNLIQFDSTYTYFYSGPKGYKESLNDSIFNGFRSSFEKVYTGMMDRNMNKVFLNDSLFKYDFFNDDYFEKRFRLNETVFEQMYKQMDSMKQEFLKQKYPNVYQKKRV